MYKLSKSTEVYECVQYDTDKELIEFISGLEYMIKDDSIIMQTSMGLVTVDKTDWVVRSKTTGNFYVYDDESFKLFFDNIEKP